MEYWYLGPASWPVWIRKRLPYAKLFNEAAMAHDAFYGYGSTESDRMTADLLFLRMCLEESKTWPQRSFALFYFCMVRRFGHTRFQYSHFQTQ